MVIGIDIGLKNNGIYFSDGKLEYYLLLKSNGTWQDSFKLIVQFLKGNYDFINICKNETITFKIENVIYFGRFIPTNANMNRLLGALIIFINKMCFSEIVLVPPSYTKKYCAKYYLYKNKKHSKHEWDAYAISKYENK